MADRDRELLTEFMRFLGLKIGSLALAQEGMDSIDAFLAARQPQAAPCHVYKNDPAKYDLCSVGHAPPPGYAPPAPQAAPTTGVTGAMGPGSCPGYTVNKKIPLVGRCAKHGVVDTIDGTCPHCALPEWKPTGGGR